MLFHRQPRRLAAAVLAVSLVGTTAAAPTLAQENEQNQVKTDWSEQKIEQFVQASIALGEAQDKWGERIRNAESQQKKRQLQQQANMQVKKVIEDQGLSTAEYNRIYKAAEQDQELYKEITARIQEAREN
jgi:hypothetical protein